MRLRNFPQVLSPLGNRAKMWAHSLCPSMEDTLYTLNCLSSQPETAGSQLPQAQGQASVLQENEFPSNQSWKQLLFYRDVVS